MAEYKVLVCGGRDYNDKDKVFATLDLLHPTPTLIIHGAARGADTLAGEWARARDVECKDYHANWRQYGKNAGPKRNQYMLDVGKPDLVIAFPGGTGTTDMVHRAVLAGVKVKEVK